MIAFTPTSAAIEDAADTPTGRHTASGAGSSGAHATANGRNLTVRALGIREGEPLKEFLDYRDALAKWWASRGTSPLSGQHATKCPYAESAGHTGECTFDTRMHGAVLVRPTGERVAAPVSLMDVAFPHLSVAASGLMSLGVR